MSPWTFSVKHVPPIYSKKDESYFYYRQSWNVVMTQALSITEFRIDFSKAIVLLSTLQISFRPFLRI